MEGGSATEVTAILERARFEALFENLAFEGYRLIGPTVKNDAVVLGEIEQVSDLPIGRTARSEAGKYRLMERGEPRLFAYPPEPNGLKPFLFPPRRKLWESEGSGATLRILPEPAPDRPMAFIGLHACDLSGLAILDRVLLGGPYIDTSYKAVRDAAFLVAVNCGGAASTCFCASLGTGPRVKAPHDLCLTEILDAEGHRFLVSAGSDKGMVLMQRLPLRQATQEEQYFLETATANAVRMQERRLDTHRLKERLYEGAEHPRWNEIAAKCLACGNCTSVCPTCFCFTVEDTSDLSGTQTSRTRVWDSCFNQEFSYIHGGSVRSSTASRYRHWLTHKLGAWEEQFGSLGCVGCGRCIAWCPAGIDIVQEANAIGGGAAVIDRERPFSTLDNPQETHLIGASSASSGA